MYTWNDGTYLMHHGIKGQKWGVRRFQNEDGSYTEEGRKRRGFGNPEKRAQWKARKKEMRASRDEYYSKWKRRNKTAIEETNKAYEETRKRYYDKKNMIENEYKRSGREIDKADEYFIDFFTAQQKRAYEKATAKKEALRLVGKDYVERKMMKDYGEDYNKMIREDEIKTFAIAGSAFAAMFGAMIYATARR